MENKYYNIIDGYLDRILRYNESAGLPRIIIDAMRYSVLGGGKHMRPTLLLGVCEALGGDIDKALPFAGAIELIHSYSLIHDDLPAMDNDDYRRGRLSCHKEFGESIAILTGDALLNLAFETMLETLDSPDPATCIRACRDIAEAAGYRGMVGGQALEFATEASELDCKKVLAIHKLKTGALICASVLVGARLADTDADTIEIMRSIGQKFGLAFQIMDDLSDAPCDADKQTASDNMAASQCKAMNQSSVDAVNYVSLAGREHSLSYCDELRGDIAKLLSELKLENGFLHKYINFILTGEA